MRQWRVGGVTVTQVVEHRAEPFPAQLLFADATPALVQGHAWLQPDFATPDGRILMSIHAFVVESRGRRIIVDTCVGNDKPRRLDAWNLRQGRFLEDLAAAGFAPDRMDTVLCTHMHADHVGWNTRLVAGRWVPTFERARYLFARREWEHACGEPVGEEGIDDVVGDSLRPIVAAGLADLVESDHRITDEVWLEPTPGHTPGHVSVRIASQGREAVITGDVMHHPLQCCEPDLRMNLDLDSVQATRTRRDFLARYADRDVLVLGTHFAPPTAGWFVRVGDRWRLGDRPWPGSA